LVLETVGAEVEEKINPELSKLWDNPRFRGAIVGC
jgi:hypothetical protein